MTTPDRGVCTDTGKARFTHAEATNKVRRAKLRGHAMTLYRCKHCDGWWHTTHAGNDPGGGGVRRNKQRIPNAALRRARSGKRKR